MKPPARTGRARRNDAYTATETNWFRHEGHKPAGPQMRRKRGASIHPDTAKPWWEQMLTDMGDHE